jgi:hypothetical protein
MKKFGLIIFSFGDDLIVGKVVIDAELITYYYFNSLPIEL